MTAQTQAPRNGGRQPAEPHLRRVHVPLRGTCERYDPLIQWRLTTAAGALLAEQ